jgi:hypothetical protein
MNTLTSCHQDRARLDLGGLLSFLIGLVGWIVLKLMKDELHLNITFDSEKKN